MSTLLISLLLSIAAWGQTAVHEREKQACSRFLLGGADASGESFQDHLINAEQRLKNIKDMTRAKVQLTIMGTRVASIRSEGLETDKQLKAEQAEIAKAEEKIKKFDPCKECNGVKDELDQLETRMKGLCPSNAKELQQLIDPRKKQYKEVCGKPPVTDLCKKK